MLWQAQLYCGVPELLDEIVYLWSWSSPAVRTSGGSWVTESASVHRGMTPTWFKVGNPFLNLHRTEEMVP